MKLGKPRSFVEYGITGSHLPKKLQGSDSDLYEIKTTVSSGRESPARFCTWEQECHSLSFEALRRYIRANYKPYTLLSIQDASGGTVLNLKLTPDPGSLCSKFSAECSNLVVHLLIQPAVHLRV